MLTKIIQKAVAAEVKPLYDRIRAMERKLGQPPVYGSDKPRAGQGEHADLKPRRKRRKKAKQSPHERKGHYRRVVRSDGTVDHVWIDGYKVATDA